MWVALIIITAIHFHIILRRSLPYPSDLAYHGIRRTKHQKPTRRSFVHSCSCCPHLTSTPPLVHTWVSKADELLTLQSVHIISMQMFAQLYRLGLLKLTLWAFQCRRLVSKCIRWERDIDLICTIELRDTEPSVSWWPFYNWTWPHNIIRSTIS